MSLLASKITKILKRFKLSSVIKVGYNKTDVLAKLDGSNYIRFYENGKSVIIVTRDTKLEGVFKGIIAHLIVNKYISKNIKNYVTGKPIKIEKFYFIVPRTTNKI